MLLGVREDCVYGELSLREKMTLLKEMGYDFLEWVISAEMLEELSPAHAEAQAKLIEETGLPALSTSTAITGLAEMAPERRAHLTKRLCALVEVTKAVGADAILLATWEPPQGPVDPYVDVYRETLGPVADAAAEVGVTLALEHVSTYKPYRLAELVEAINHPAVRIYFDMGNCLNVGENPLEQAKICAPLTKHLHIKGGPVAPLASMPLVQVKEILEKGGFTGRGCLEIKGTDERNRHLLEALGLLKMAGYR